MCEDRRITEYGTAGYFQGLKFAPIINVKKEILTKLLLWIVSVSDAIISLTRFHQFSQCKGVARVYFLPRHWLNFSKIIRIGKSRELHAVLGLRPLLGKLPRLSQW